VNFSPQIWSPTDNLLVVQMDDFQQHQGPVENINRTYYSMLQQIVFKFYKHTSLQVIHILLAIFLLIKTSLSTLLNINAPHFSVQLTTVFKNFVSVGAEKCIIGISSAAQVLTCCLTQHLTRKYRRILGIIGDQRAVFIFLFLSL